MLVLAGMVVAVCLLALWARGCGSAPYAIVIDGRPVCYVRDERAAQEVHNRLLAEARRIGGGAASVEETWEVACPQVLSVQDAVKALKEKVHVQVEAYAIEVDGTPLVYVPSEPMAKQVLEAAKKHFVEDGVRLLEPPKFRQKVRIVPAVVRLDKLVADVEGAVEKLFDTGGERIYVVRRGDTPLKIARRFGTTLKRLYELNPGMKGRDLRVGEKVRVPSTKPALTVVTVRELQVRRPVPPPEQLVPTASLLKGQRRVKSEGAPGEKLMVRRVVFENDKRIKAQTTSEKIIKKPQPRVVEVGTRAPPPPAPAGPAQPAAQPTSR